jgi:hypothetical protein
VSLADTMHHAGLRALLALGHGETDGIADLQAVEPIIGHAVAVKIDLLAVACLDEPVPLIGDEPDDAAAEGRRHMMLHPCIELADVILELAYHGVEGITHRHIGVLVRVIPRAGPAHASGERGERGRRDPRRWSAGITTVSTYPPPRLFTESAETIAETMARPEVSPGGLGAAIRMVTFFANRAGRTLPAERVAELARAKQLLRERKAAAAVMPPAERAPGRYRHVALGPVMVERRGRGWVMRCNPGAAPIALGPDAWSYLRRV